MIWLAQTFATKNAARLYILALVRDRFTMTLMKLKVCLICMSPLVYWFSQKGNQKITHVSRASELGSSHGGRIYFLWQQSQSAYVFYILNIVAEFQNQVCNPCWRKLFPSPFPSASMDTPGEIYPFVTCFSYSGSCVTFFLELQASWSLNFKVFQLCFAST